MLVRTAHFLIVGDAMPSGFFENDGRRATGNGRGEADRWYAIVKVTGNSLLRRVDALLACTTDEAKIHHLKLHRAHVESIIRRAAQIQSSSSEVNRSAPPSHMKLH